MVAAVILVPLVLARLGLDDRAQLLVRILRWPAMAAMLLAALLILFRYGPSRRPPGWRWLTIGAIAAAALWLAGSSLLSLYLSHFADYTATYGSLGAAIGLMTWMGWMSATIVLVGAVVQFGDRKRGRSRVPAKDRLMELSARLHGWRSSKGS